MKTEFVIHYIDLEGAQKALHSKIAMHPGETREQWVRDVLDNGFRVELVDNRGFARRYSARQILAVDYEMA